MLWANARTCLHLYKFENDQQFLVYNIIMCVWWALQPCYMRRDQASFDFIFCTRHISTFFLIVVVYLIFLFLFQRCVNNHIGMWIDTASTYEDLSIDKRNKMSKSHKNKQMFHTFALFDFFFFLSLTIGHVNTYLDFPCIAADFSNCNWTIIDRNLLVNFSRPAMERRRRKKKNETFINWKKNY